MLSATKKVRNIENCRNSLFVWCSIERRKNSHTKAAFVLFFESLCLIELFSVATFIKAKATIYNRRLGFHFSFGILRKCVMLHQMKMVSMGLKSKRVSKHPHKYGFSLLFIRNSTLKSFFRIASQSSVCSKTICANGWNEWFKWTNWKGVVTDAIEFPHSH